VIIRKALEKKMNTLKKKKKKKGRKSFIGEKCGNGGQIRLNKQHKKKIDTNKMRINADEMD
jgi:hypothetical protein